MFLERLSEGSPLRAGQCRQASHSWYSLWLFARSVVESGRVGILISLCGVVVPPDGVLVSLPVLGDAGGALTLDFQLVDGCVHLRALRWTQRPERL